MINRTVLTGRLTKDIELKKTNSNKSVIQCSLACEGYQKHVDYINVVVWNQGAEYLSKYAHKGDLIAVDGRLSSRSYDGKNGKVYVTEVVAENVQICSSKKQEEQQDEYEDCKDNSNWKNKGNTIEDSLDIGPDDLPFYWYEVNYESWT